MEFTLELTSAGFRIAAPGIGAFAAEIATPHAAEAFRVLVAQANAYATAPAAPIALPAPPAAPAPLKNACVPAKLPRAVKPATHTYETWHAARAIAVAHATFENGLRWDLAPDRTWAHIPASIANFRGIHNGRKVTITGPRDTRIPAARFWPNGQIPDCAILPHSSYNPGGTEYTAEDIAALVAPGGDAGRYPGCEVPTELANDNGAECYEEQFADAAD